VRDALRLRPRLALALLALLSLVPAAIGAASRDFWRPDEPDFAQHAREMLQRRELAVPFQNGVPFAEKPILLYWSILAMTPLSGGTVTPFTARIPSLVGAALLLLVAGAAARRMGDGRDGPVALAILAATPLFFWQAQFIQMDALFSGLLAAALYVEMGEVSSAAPSRKRAALGHVLLALAVLTKGPLAIIVAAFVPCAEMVRERSLRPLRALFPMQACAILALLTAPWYVLVTARLGFPYAHELLVRQNVTRFLKAWDHVHPFWYYVGEKVWSDFFPWTLPALLALLLFARAGSLRDDPHRRGAAVVLLASIVFLSLSQSKQGKYLLFAYPFGAALLAAAVGDIRREPARVPDGLTKWLRTVLIGTAGLLVLVAMLLPAIASDRFPEFRWQAWPAAVALGVGGLLAVAAAWRGPRELARPIVALAASLLVAQAVVAGAVFPAVDVAKTARPLYERLKPRVANGEALVYASSRFRCYALLVLDRRLCHAPDAPALSRWLSRHPDGWVIAEKRELDRWKSGLPANLQVFDSQAEGDDVGLILRLATATR